jgi:hypothetical protein
MGAAYTIGGVMVGAACAKASAAEPTWDLLIFPALIAFWVGRWMEHTKS